MPDPAPPPTSPPPRRRRAALTPAERMRRQVLAEWRGGHEPSARPTRPVAVAAQVAAALLRELGQKIGPGEAVLAEVWRELAGEFLAAHTAPAKLIAGVLTVRVMHPTLRFELERRWKRELLEKLRARFGAGVVRELAFRLG